MPKLSFKNEGDINTLPGKQKLKRFDTSRISLQKMLRRVLQIEIKRHIDSTSMP